MLQSLISENYAFLFLTIITFILLCVNTLIEKNIRKLFFTLLVFEIIESVLASLPSFLDSSYSGWFFTSLLSHINYIIRPLLLYLVLLISERSRSRKFRFILSIPLIITALLLIISIPTKLVVYYSYPDKIFHEGPLFIVSWFILIIYLVLILISAFITTKKRAETFTIIICILFINCNIIFELMNKTIPGMQQTVIALSVLAYYLYFQSQTYTSYRLETERRLAKAQVQAMISQIKPHFIYNSLSCIAEICHEGSPEGENAILTFSNYLRSCLNSLEDDGLVPFSQELKTIKNFADLELLQASGKLNMLYDIKESSFRVPVLSIETLVENAVKHGIRKTHSGGTVTLRTFKSDHLITLQIEDDGIGFDINSVSYNPNQLGLSNARMRLKEQCNADFQIQSKPGEGTKIQITIPEDKSK